MYQVGRHKRTLSYLKVLITSGELLPLISYIFLPQLISNERSMNWDGRAAYTQVLLKLTMEWPSRGSHQPASKKKIPLTKSFTTQSSTSIFSSTAVGREEKASQEGTEHVSSYSNLMYPLWYWLMVNMWPPHTDWDFVSSFLAPLNIFPSPAMLTLHFT